MEKAKTTKATAKNTQKATPGGGRGGARAGSGRKAGGKNKITIESLLEKIQDCDGRAYEELLIEDFLKARKTSDSQLVIKYHNLILNKVLSTLNKVEVTESEDQVEQKQQAFAEALAKLTGFKKD